MPLALALLCELVDRAPSLKRALLTGWLFGLGNFTVGLNWIQFAFTFQDKMPHWLGYLAVVLLSLYLAIYPALAAGLAWRLGRERPFALALALAGGWVVTEWLRATMFTGFAWNPLGVTLIDTPWGARSALIGTYGLSCLVVLAGGALWLFARGQWGKSLGIFAVAGLLLTWPLPMVADQCCLRTFDVGSNPEHFDGTAKPATPPAQVVAPPPAPSSPGKSSAQPDSPLPAPPQVPPPPREVPPPPALTPEQQRAYLLNHQIFHDARVVQPNIGQQDKWRPGCGEIAAARLAGLSTKPVTDSPRLLFWPEAAVTEPLEDARSDEHQAFAQFERTRAAALLRPGDLLLTGGIALNSTDGFRISGAANSVFMIDSDGKVIGRYDKAHLVPYGEYLPMRPLLSAIGLSRLAPGDIDFNPGPGPRTLRTPGFGKVGFQLCYEIIFSGEVVDRRDRPDFIFNPSNDAWFGRWGPPQHLAQARLRAAEEGIPVIRSTPTGISAIIDARGRVVNSLPWQTAGFIDSQLPMAAAGPTFFGRFGNAIPLTLGFLLIIAAIALGNRRRYSRT
jgi:apolipoprotein N-acyltransferase